MGDGPNHNPHVGSVSVFDFVFGLSILMLLFLIENKESKEEEK